MFEYHVDEVALPTFNSTTSEQTITFFLQRSYSMFTVDKAPPFSRVLYGNLDRHQADTGEAAVGEHGRAASGVGRRGASPSVEPRGFGQKASPAHVGGREHGRKRRTTLRQEGVPSAGSSVVLLLLLLLLPGREREPFHALLHSIPAIVGFESGSGGTSIIIISCSARPVVDHFHESVHAVAAIGVVRFESGTDGRSGTSVAPDRYRKALHANLRGGTCSCRG